MIQFSRFRLLFILVSTIGIVSLLATTYIHFGGFKQSISFNGGIRFSMILPAGMNKDSLEAAFTRAGYKPDQVRVTDLIGNKYDVELGPALRDQVAARLKQEERERDAQAEILRRAGKPIPAELRRSYNVLDVIESAALAELKLEPQVIQSRETIAASYGENLTEMAIGLLGFTFAGIGIYLTFRFRFAFALGASLALLHDLFFTIGFIGVMRIEPSIPVLAGVLTVIGYSINDTIVIFDRIRETAEDHAQATVKATMNLAITQTLSRTTITSLLTLLAVLALLLGGAQTLIDFGLVIAFGIVVGTYSSIFIAAHFVQYYEEFRARLRGA
ncbi:MAG: protein translocase subunit SecF [Leptospirales bacterium]|nr:protein translocase subunit SecF [Leptospirales bacterium]